MSSCALVGPTGTIGSHVLTHLLTDTRQKMHCSVRSRQKLLALPVLSRNEEYQSRLVIHEGSVTDVESIQRCIENAQIVFLCAAASSNLPGCQIAQDQARSIVSALRNIRNEDPSAKMPKLIMLSSAETEPKFSAEIPWLANIILSTASVYIYSDLKAAERYLLEQEEWISTVFVKPGGLSHDIRRGHAISEEKQQTFLSYKDLAAGMVEIADVAVEGDRWDGKSVSVLSPSGKAKVERMVPVYMVKGILIYLFPWSHPYIG